MKVMLLAGHSATGKTSVARMIAQKYDCELLLERAIIDRIVEKRGFDRARDCVKKFGFEPLLEETREETVKRINNCGKQNIILDGAYDGRIPAYLKDNLKGAELIVVGIASNRSMRRHRMMQRSGLPMNKALKELRFIDKIKERIGAHEVVRKADVMVKNRGRLDEFLFVLNKLAECFFGAKKL